MRSRVALGCLLALLVLFAGCAGRESQAGAACPRGAPPDYVLTFQSSPPSRDDSESVEDLSRQGELGFGRLALGLTEVQLSLSMDYNYRVAPALAGGVCIDPVRVTYRLAYAKRVVHVAREFDHEPCLHGEILAHEMRHVALDDQLLTEKRSELLAELPARLDGASGIWGKDAAEANRLLLSRLRDAGEAMVAELKALRMAEHARQIDTPEEQLRMGRVCNGRVRELFPAAS
jgi:hypothetical protein